VTALIGGFKGSTFIIAVGKGEMHLVRLLVRLLMTSAIALSLTATAQAQPAPSGPSAVGVIEATTRPIIETSEFLGIAASPKTFRTSCCY
jgi:hypothetical protein